MAQLSTLLNDLDSIISTASSQGVALQRLNTQQTSTKFELAPHGEVHEHEINESKTSARLTSRVLALSSDLATCRDKLEHERANADHLTGLLSTTVS